MNQQQNLPEILTSPLTSNEYYVEKKINQGSEGTVYKGYFIDKGEKIDVAIKISYNMKDDEIQFLDQLTLKSQENLIKLYEVFIVRKPKKMFVSVMELATQNLYDYQNSQEWNNMTEENKIKLIIDIAKGLRQLHQLKFSHRDLKPENILKFGDTWKLCDFGLTKYVVSVLQTTHIGTPYYFSPEIISFQNNGQDYGNEVDMWAFGCIIFEILANNLFFNGTSFEDLIQKIGQYCNTFVNKDYKNIDDPRFMQIKDPELQDLCKQLLIVNSKMRITSEKALEFLLEYQKNRGKISSFNTFQVNSTTNQEIIPKTLFGNNQTFTPQKQIPPYQFITQNPQFQKLANAQPIKQQQQFNMNLQVNVLQTSDEKSQGTLVTQGNFVNQGLNKNFPVQQPNQFPPTASPFQNQSQKSQPVQNFSQQQQINQLQQNEGKNVFEKKRQSYYY